MSTKLREFLTGYADELTERLDEEQMPFEEREILTWEELKNLRDRETAKEPVDEYILKAIGMAERSSADFLFGTGWCLGIAEAEEETEEIREKYGAKIDRLQKRISDLKDVRDSRDLEIAALRSR